MKPFLLISLLFFSFPLFANEVCTLDALGLAQEKSEAARLFYTGTCHYRNKDYDKAVEFWVKLARLKKVDHDHQELQIDVLNNLGYMKYFGLGIEQNETEAITYWTKAVSLGHHESEYHLCHAYADKQKASYSLARAIKHCNKAKRAYQGLEETKDRAIILRQIDQYLRGMW